MDTVHHARRRRVPGDRRGHDPGPAAGMEPEVVVRRAGIVRGVEEADHEQDLGDLQRQEDSEDSRVHLHAADQHVRVEDCEREQEPGQGVRQVTAGVAGEPPRRVDAENDEEAEAHPERAVRRKRGGAEDVPVAELPHPGRELSHAAVEDRRPDPDQVGDPRGVVPAEQERRKRESRQTERCGIGGRCALD